jgi:hypothetical protein
VGAPGGEHVARVGVEDSVVVCLPIGGEDLAHGGIELVAVRGEPGLDHP